jgi:hypothetical protein
MTLVSDIIQRAYRVTNLIPLGATVSTNQSTEALNHLNTLIASTMGFEAGDELKDINYGGDYDQSEVINEWVPDNVRLVLNLSAATTLQLDPEPYEGQRLALIDVAGNLATYNLILDGNGRNIEGAATLTLSTNSIDRQWMYRADTGNWVRVTTLATSDQMPFPVDFDDYWIKMLAMQLNPSYGQMLSTETFQSLGRIRSRLRSRYRRTTFDIQTDPGLLGPNETGRLSHSTAFNTGRFWPWLR